MAIITHNTSKNANYGDVYRYYKFKHKEDPDTGQYEAILDNLGFLQERQNYSLTYINPQGKEAAPELWEGACRRTNLCFQKNQKFHDRKHHEYIISHPEEDRPNMTMEDLLEEGRAFVRENLLGYDAIIAVHRDTDNDHIHITINSVRALAREEQPWMLHDEDGNVLPCEIMAGGKHQDSPGFRHHYNDWLLNYTRSHGWVEKDNNAIAAAHKQERQAEKKSPHDRLKELLLAAAAESDSMEGFRQRLEEQQIQLQIRGKTISVIPQGAKKAIRLRSLGLDADELVRMIQGISSEQWELESASARQIAEDAQWLQKCREKNERQTAAAMEAAETVLEHAAASSSLEELTDALALKRAIQKNLYARRDLKIEQEKLDRLLDRWEEYQSTDDPEKKEPLRKYIQYCGFTPDQQTDHEELQAMRDMAVHAIKDLELQHKALSSYAPRQIPESRQTQEDAEEQVPEDEIGSAWDINTHRSADSDTWWTKSYKHARMLRYGNKAESVEADPEQAYRLMEQEAAQGNGFAMHDLGDMNRRGQGCEINEELADRYYQDALAAFLEKVKTEKFPNYLQYRIGKMYLQGLGTPQDYKEAAQWFSLAVSGKKPNPFAAYSLAGMYRRGQGVEADQTEAFRLYMMAASHSNSGNAYANYELANMLQLGIGTTADPQEAQRRYEMAYHGFQKLEDTSLDEKLLYRIGQMNYQGQGTQKDLDLAVSYFERAAKLKNPNALFGLGKIFLDKEYQHYDPEKGIRYLQQAAELDNAFAQTRLGKMYMTGEHLPQDLDAAIQLFSAAAKQKESMAQYYLGKICYAPPDDRERDLPRAVWYLEQASASNNAQAQTLLGKILLNEEPYRDQTKAVELLRKAAEQKNAEALYQLGKLLSHSNSHQARATAVQYLEQAVSQEYAPAMVLLGRILINEPNGTQMTRGIDLLLAGHSETDFSAKDLLKEIRHSRKTLGQIAYNCQRAANRRIYDEDYSKKAEQYRTLWYAKLQQEKLLKERLRQERRDGRQQPSESGSRSGLAR